MKRITATTLMTVFFALALPLVALAAPAPGESRDQPRIVREDPISRIVKAVRRIIARLDEPQAPPPTTHP
jgi:hypothetical protein